MKEMKRGIYGRLLIRDQKKCSLKGGVIEVWLSQGRVSAVSQTRLTQLSLNVLSFTTYCTFSFQELIALIKNSKIPIICMCNDRNSPKIRSLANYCFDLRFQRPRVEQIKVRRGIGRVALFSSSLLWCSTLCVNSWFQRFSCEIKTSTLHGENLLYRCSCD